MGCDYLLLHCIRPCAKDGIQVLSYLGDLYLDLRPNPNTKIAFIYQSYNCKHYGELNRITKKILGSTFKYTHWGLTRIKNIFKCAQDV